LRSPRQRLPRSAAAAEGEAEVREPAVAVVREPAVGRGRPVARDPPAAEAAGSI